MRRNAVVAALLVVAGVVLLTAGCGGDEDQASLLSAHPWQLTQIKTEGGMENAVDGVISTADFGSQGLVTGEGGVNRYRAPYQLDDQMVAIGDIASTRMAGPAPAMEQETRFFGVLRSVTQYRISNDELELLDGSRKVIARMKSYDE